MTFFLILKKKIGQRGEATRWRVCYQRGLPRLVPIGIAKIPHICSLETFFLCNNQKSLNCVAYIHFTCVAQKYHTCLIQTSYWYRQNTSYLCSLQTFFQIHLTFIASTLVSCLYRLENCNFKSQESNTVLALLNPTCSLFLCLDTSYLCSSKPTYLPRDILLLQPGYLLLPV